MYWSPLYHCCSIPVMIKMDPPKLVSISQEGVWQPLRLVLVDARYRGCHIHFWLTCKIPDVTRYVLWHFRNGVKCTTSTTSTDSWSPKHKQFSNRVKCTTSTDSWSPKHKQFRYRVKCTTSTDSWSPKQLTVWIQLLWKKVAFSNQLKIFTGC